MYVERIDFLDAAGCKCRRLVSITRSSRRAGDMGNGALYSPFGPYKLNVGIAHLKALDYVLSDERIDELVHIMKVLELTWSEVCVNKLGSLCFECAHSIPDDPPIRLHVF
jgi:hypothetical protein